MDLLEYQGKRYFATYGIPVPEGAVASTPEEAREAAGTVGLPAAVKAQVPVGGRGKAGGVRVAATVEEVVDAAAAILGMDIAGHLVRRVWVERASTLEREYYASFTLDRGARLHVGILSARGGVDIEEVAAEDPGAVIRLHVDPNEGLAEERVRGWVEESGIDAVARDAVAAVLMKLWGSYTAGDADLVEINPLVLTRDGMVRALDAKVVLDDSAAFRHPEWDAFRADVEAGSDPRERLARGKGLNYIGLDGSVGVIGNGAGLVMSTLDVVHQAGGAAANFLDVGGGAGADVIADALEVVSTDKKVRAILVNIFGGITRCDEVARGVLAALERVRLEAPIVVRLDGTNGEEGRRLLASHESEQLVAEATMMGAAARAVELAASRSGPR